MTAASMSAKALVDLSAGQISREIFVSPELYQQEQEQGKRR